MRQNMIFVQNGCYICTALLDRMAMNNIASPVPILNISQDMQAREIFFINGGEGTPAILMNGQMHTGMNSVRKVLTQQFGIKF